ncbi:ATP-binding cassette domain-containing protein [Frankia sp. AgB1.9]|uniref:ABC transporter permease subunit n=1 Tax=unclassified Frankia TaxID=2632575 RepID=UPI0019327485|nr:MULTISPECIES: ATP-binding cassette domain-containing protein [unclassified Frankia]MBL7486973.1 ATP-binding cassette domain-containing protein [Frankia sp. AgW1.1]MBL7548836.1 ATP-binding cassette domain-containing protein [Frankia sp. AgB1.9]MBL7619674.1 ATP-binding cassette domain-containing protein [Frankia sp. AgB1.8]
MTEFVNLVVAGLVTGALYAILASGLTLSYQTSGVFNFGQGGIAFSTAYLFFQLNTGQKLPIVLSAIICIGIFAPLLGWVLHLVLFNPLRESSIAAKMVASLGLLIALPSLGLWIVALLKDWLNLASCSQQNPKARCVPEIEDVFRIPGLGPSPKKIHSVGNGLIIDSDQLSMLGAAIFAAVLLWYLVRHTRIGLEMRAAVSRPNLAALRGVDPDRASAVSWITSCGLAGLVGVLLAPMFGLSSFSYTTLLFISIPAVVLGRMASIPIAMLGGLLLGVVQNLVNGYVTLDITGFPTAVPFIILFGLLIYFGAERGRSAGTTLEEKPSADELGGDAARWRRRTLWSIAVVGLLAYTAWGATDFWAGLLAQGLATAIVLLSFTVVTGIGGMVSLAQAAFVLSGAFTAGILLGHGVPFVPALIAGTLVSAFVGLVVALPTRRLGGLPLALSTLALAFIGENLLFQIHSISNGSSGWKVTPPRIAGLDTSNPRWLVLLLVALVGLGVWVVHALRSSSTGRAMLAVRSSEVGARTSGIAVDRMKLLLFVISAGIAGFGGVMLAAAHGRVTRTDFTVLLGLVWLATTVTLSIRRPAGAVLAGLVSALAPQVLEHVPASTYFMQLVFGLGAISLARDPDGGLAAGSRARREWSVRRAAKATTERHVPVATTAPAAPLDASAVADGVEPVLRVTGLKAGYGEIEVLHGLDLTIGAGQAVALLGSNGAGKTTLCSVVGGLVEARAGSVWLAGRDVTQVPARRRERDSVYLAPEGRGIFPDLTVEENLTIWLRDAAEREAAFDAFPVLKTRRGQAAGTMSGGEQQMLTLAPALVRPPKLLVADEPSLGLAPLIIEQIFAALGALQSRGTALLIAEEKTRDALAIADRVAFLTVGHITWTGPSAEVDADRLATAYLGIAPDAAVSPATAPVGRRDAVATSGAPGRDGED